MVDFVAGSLAGAVVDTCLYPFDTLRARMMGRTLSQRGGLLAEALRVVRAEGARALYKGLPLHLLACLPGNGVFYYTYETAKTVLSPHISSDAGSQMLAAATGCIASLIIYTPMEVVKQRVMVRRGVSSHAMLRSVLADGGIRELYRGISAGVLTWVPYLSLYFMMYESLIANARPIWPSEAHPKDPTFFAVLTSGITAGVCAAVLTHPFDVIRTRIQLGGAGTPDSVWLMVRSIAATEGAAGFSRGILARTMQLAPTSSLTIVCFSALKRTIEDRSKE